MEENKVKEVEVKAAPVAENSNENTEKRRPAKKFSKGKNFKRNPRREIVKEYDERVIKIKRVTKVVKGGKRMKFTALVVIGNGKGKFSFASGKSGEVPDAIKKAVEAAKRNVSSVKITKTGSIAHEVVGHFGASKVFLKPAPEGTGIIAGGSVRAVLELAGFKNIYSKVYGSRTQMNVVRATAAALNQLKDYNQVIALRQGGKEDVK